MKTSDPSLSPKTHYIYENGDLEISMGLSSKHIETKYLQNKEIETNLYGIDTNLKFFPFDNKYLFFGIGYQYLTNNDEERITYNSVYLPIGIDVEYFGLYYVLGANKIKNLYENKITGSEEGAHIYFRLHENMSLHLGITNLEMQEENDSEDYNYSGKSYNVSLQYIF